MTHPRLRRPHRSSDGRKPVLAGDFPPGDRDITEALPLADWDGSTYTWGGASGAGLPDGDHDPTESNPPASPGHDATEWNLPVTPAGEYRQAIAEANAAPLAAPPGTLRARPPATFPALPDAPPPPRPQYPGPGAAPRSAGPRDTGPQAQLPRLSRTAARPRPRRDTDEAIFVWSDLLKQHVMLCGTCPPERRSRYADPITGHMPFAFESLRQSAYVSGWRLDAFSRWACPECQLNPAYWSPRQVVQWDPDAIEAAQAGDAQAEYWHRLAAARKHPEAEYARWVIAVGGEVAHRAAAELDLITDVAAGAGRGRHRAGVR